MFGIMRGVKSSMFVFVLGKPSFKKNIARIANVSPSLFIQGPQYQVPEIFPGRTKQQILRIVQFSEKKIANPSIQIAGPKNIQHNETIVYFPNEFINFGISVVL